MAGGHEEMEALKETFGEDYRRGIMKKPEIMPSRQYSRSRVQQSQKCNEERRDHRRKEVIKKSLVNAGLKRGRLTGLEMAKYNNLLT